MIRDQLDELVEDQPSGRVMTIALHPFVIGQAIRIKYLDRALAYVANHPDVWLRPPMRLQRTMPPRRRISRARLQSR